MTQFYRPDFDPYEELYKCQVRIEELERAVNVMRDNQMNLALAYNDLIMHLEKIKLNKSN